MSKKYHVTTTVNGDEYEFLAGERPPKLFEEGSCRCECFARRAMAQLEHIAEQNDAIGPGG